MVLFLPGDDKPVDKADVLQTLGEAGVVHGLMEEKVDEIVQSNIFNRWFTVAVYTPPLNGEDAKLGYLVSEDYSHKRKQNGSADYYDLDRFKNITTGQPLIRKIPASEGVEGTTVLGKALPAYKGQDINLKEYIGGDGVFVDPDDPNLIISAINGVYYRLGSVVNVKKIFTINHDIDFNTGNINTLSGIRINGDIKGGFTVITKRNLIVAGVIENAAVKAEEDIEVLKGIVRGDAEISAGGKITTTYIVERTPVKADKIVVKNMVVGSELFARDFIKARKIVGGKVMVGNLLDVIDLGNKRSNPTEVEAGINPLLFIRHQKLLSVIAALKFEKRKLLESRVEAEFDYEGTEEKIERMQFGRTIRLSSGLSRKLEERLKRASRDIERYNRKIKELDAKLLKKYNELKSISPGLNLKNPEIIVRGTIYPNVYMRLGPYAELRTTEEMSNIKFFLDSEGALAHESLG